MVAQQTGFRPGEFIWAGGDCHLYRNHLEQADVQLRREPYALPRLVIARRPPSLFDYRFEDFEVIDYEAHPHLRAEVAV
jgi:thymidylate synthase